MNPLKILFGLKGKHPKEHLPKASSISPEELKAKLDSFKRPSYSASHHVESGGDEAMLTTATKPEIGFRRLP